MRALVGLALAACTASTPPPRAPAPVPVARSPPVPPVPSLSPSERLLAHLPIHEGLIPGTHLELMRVPGDAYCGGQGLEVVRSAVAAPEFPQGGSLRAFDVAMSEQLPDDIDAFGEPNRTGIRAAEIFAAWTSHVLVNMRIAYDSLSQNLDLVGAPSRIHEAVERLAFRVVLQRRAAALFGRALIPRALLSSPAQRAGWCDALAARTLPLVDQANADAARCRDLAARSDYRGWWDDACVIE